MEELLTSDQIGENFNLPCPSCGSQLRYSAKNKKITCDHCGYLEEVNHANDKVVEKSLHDALNKKPEFVPEDIGKKVFNCDSCGAKFMVESDRLKVNCGFCGSRNVNLEAFKHNYILPVGIIPFYISRDEAMIQFDKWISEGWWTTPYKFRNAASLENLHGIYLPFWTFDANAKAQWSGQAGVYQQNMQTAMQGMRGGRRGMSMRGAMRGLNTNFDPNQPINAMGNANGNGSPVQVRWQSKSGNLAHFFDDVLVVGSMGLEQSYINKILPFRLEEVVNFDPLLMVNWEAEIYSMDVDRGYHFAEQIMEHRTRQMCSAQLGGDTQRNLQVSNQLSDQTFKHIILPLWISSYTYKDKIYHFTINGQTGKIYGKKPKSFFIPILIGIIFVLALVGIWFLGRM